MYGMLFDVNCTDATKIIEMTKFFSRNLTFLAKIGTKFIDDENLELYGIALAPLFMH